MRLLRQAIAVTVAVGLAGKLAIASSGGAGLCLRPRSDGIAISHEIAGRKGGVLLQSQFNSQALALLTGRVPGPACGVVSRLVAEANLRWRNRKWSPFTLWPQKKQDVPETSSLPEIPIEETPLWELLSVLGLHDPDHIAGAETIDTQAPSPYLTVKKIRLTASSDDRIPSEGIAILRQYVGKTDAFELLYHEGRLMAIMPLFPMLVSRDPIPYLDLSAYSAKVPAIGDANSQAVWRALVLRQRRDQKFIRDYLQAAFPAMHYRSLRTNKGSYVYVRVDRATGERTLNEFEPGDQFNPFEKFKADPEFHQAVVPLFSTVFSPAVPKNKEADDAYYQALYPGYEMHGSQDDDVKLLPGHSVLVAGSGLGMEPWLVSLITGQKVHALDVNPLAVANTRATAKILKITVDARVHDNIVGEHGAPAFPGMIFDRVFWNMPACQWVREKRAWVLGLDTFFRRQWDGDGDGAILKRFAQWLSQILAEDGLALIWNQARFVSRGRIDRVEPILRSGDLQVQAWYHPLAKIYAGTAAIYLLRRPGTAAAA